MSRREPTEQEQIAVHDHDVLSGRGVNIAQHPGNERFRSLINTRYDANYCTNFDTSEKKALASEIVEHIRSLIPPGKFLKRCSTAVGTRGIEGPWEELTEKQTIKKTCQALRDCNRGDRAGYGESLIVPDDVKEKAMNLTNSGLSLKQYAAQRIAITKSQSRYRYQYQDNTNNAMMKKLPPPSPPLSSSTKRRNSTGTVATPPPNFSLKKQRTGRPRERNTTGMNMNYSRRASYTIGAPALLAAPTSASLVGSHQVLSGEVAGINPNYSRRHIASSFLLSSSFDPNLPMQPAPVTDGAIAIAAAVAAVASTFATPTDRLPDTATVPVTNTPSDIIAHHRYLYQQHNQHQQQHQQYRTSSVEPNLMMSHDHSYGRCHQQLAYADEDFEPGKPLPMMPPSPPRSNSKAYFPTPYSPVVRNQDDDDKNGRRTTMVGLMDDDGVGDIKDMEPVPLDLKSPFRQNLFDDMENPLPSNFQDSTIVHTEDLFRSVAASDFASFAHNEDKSFPPILPHEGEEGGVDVDSDNDTILFE